MRLYKALTVLEKFLTEEAVKRTQGMETQLTVEQTDAIALLIYISENHMKAYPDIDDYDIDVIQE